MNYRTPAEIMEVAARVLDPVDAGVAVPESVRHTGRRPRVRGVRPSEVGRVVVEIVAGVDDDRSCGVLVASGRSLDVEARVVDVRAAKGLEFDVVVVVEPEEIGRADLYVALTRATQQLFVVHSGRVPEVFADLPRS